MKRRSKIIIASIMAAVIIAASPAATLVPVTLTAEASTTNTLAQSQNKTDFIPKLEVQPTH